MSFVVDASVAIKWFVQEELHEEALEILEYGETIYSPALTLRHPIYDCFYLACAETVEAGRVVTVDKRLLRVVGNPGLEEYVVHLSDLFAEP